MTTGLGASAPHTLHADQSAFNDIRTYFGDEFTRIRLEYKDRGVDLGAVWPSKHSIEHLVAKSSAIFVYATTVIRFIDDEYSHPIDKLEALLRLDPASTAPLDDLYAEILSVMSQDTRALRILHTVWQGKCMAPEEIDMLWILRPGTCRLALRGLHSLVYVPPPDTEFLEWTGVDVLHASFRDYLCDERRSKRWCVATPALHSDYLHHLVKLLSSRPASRQTQYLYRRLVTSLPKLLADCKPADALFDLLRDEQFLNNIFLADEIDEPGWPKRYSAFPEDLIQYDPLEWCVLRTAHCRNSDSCLEPPLSDSDSWIKHPPRRIFDDGGTMRN
ncbi:hypothetical protein B0H13DRAFT_2653923 [Mycena leptocephala]|nr:hypothetical protein B0H13DRAFT_2653923 [Mycena leptocephala]